MKIILLKDVEKVGKQFEVKEVKEGYARNFLIAKGLAKPATEEALKWLEVQKKIQEKKAEDKLKEIGFDVKKTQIELPEPIKELGEFPIKIKLEHNLEVEIRVIVNKLEE